MPKNFDEIFNNLKTFEPSAKLLGSIMQGIGQERKLISIKRRLILYSFGLLASVLMFLPSFKMVQSELAQSGFSQYFSLLFSDFGVVSTYWQSFTLTLLESLPMIWLAATLAAVLVFLQSLKSLVNNLKLVWHKNIINI